VPNRQRQPTLHLTQDPSRTEQPETAGFAQVLLRPSVLLEPDRMVPPPSWLEHVPFAFWLIDVFRPRVFVELGTQSGNSYAAFAQAVQHLGLNSVGYAIDTWKGDPQAGFYDESVFTEWKEYHDRRYSSFSTLVRSTFDEAVEHFADRSIDLLNIDGYHTVDAVNHDFQTWLPRMSPRGVVLMHDINVREGDFGAWRAWAELRDAYPSFEFLHGHGLGVLAVGTDIPSEIAWLTGPGLGESSAIVAVRQFFSRSGGTIATRYRTAAAEREAAGRINAERALNAQDQAARETELAELKARVAADEAARDAHIADLTARLARTEASDQGGRQDQATRETELAQLKARAAADEAARDAHIADLTARLARTEASIKRRARPSSLKARVATDEATRDAHIADLTARLVRTEASNQAGRQDLAARETQLAELNVRVAADEAARDAHIADLTAQLARTEASNQADREELLAREVEIAGLREKLEEADARVELNAQELTALSKGLQDARSRIAELLKDIAQHTRARLVQETLLRLPANSLAAASGQIESLRARVRVLAGAIAHVPRAVPSRAARMWGTLRSLGVTPHHLARRPWSITTLARLAFRPRALGDAHLIAQSGLFDAGYYARRSPDVSACGINPLAHFVIAGGAEGRSPHPLFDSAWYLTRYPDVAAARVNPLAHYLRTGAREARDPHPLFSAAYYRSQVRHTGSAAFEPLQHYVTHGVFEERSPHPLFDPQYYVETYGHVLTDVDPFVHFLEVGAAADFNPHPLFDVAYYRRQVRQLAGSSQNPLTHYLQSGPSRNRRPHPLFDPVFYLASNRDVSAAGLEPFIHFVGAGGREGRRPVPDFDSAWYLTTYPDVARAGSNPLAHFVRYGWLERRNPSPRFDTVAYLSRHPDVAQGRTNPFVHYLEHGRAEGRIAMPEEDSDRYVELSRDAGVWLRASNLDGNVRMERVIVCLTHVMPLPPRAGNEYRIHRILRWLRQSGYVVIPIIAPIDGSRPTSAEIRTLADEYGNAVICPPDGHLEYVLRDVPDILQSLNGESGHRWATILGEDPQPTEHERKLLELDRTFCSDALISTVLRLQSVLGPYVLLAEYIWMSRVLPLLGSRALKIIDTIDVFSTRAEKVGQYGIEDLMIEPDEERLRLARADVIVAIQENERTALEVLVPGIPVVTGGVDFDVTADPGMPTGHRILYVASGNPMNRRGLRDFLRFAWPRVRELVPDAELAVVGAVGESVAIPPPGVKVLGKVADLKPLYDECRVVINPAVAGTGVKIKTLEALSYLRPVVTWPNGVDGLSPEVAALCRTVEDWYAFAEEVAKILTSNRDLWFTAADRDTLARAARPDRVYADLGRAIRAFLDAETATPAETRPQVLS